MYSVNVVASYISYLFAPNPWRWWCMTISPVYIQHMYSLVAVTWLSFWVSDMQWLSCFFFVWRATPSRFGVSANSAPPPPPLSRVCNKCACYIHMYCMWPTACTCKNADLRSVQHNTHSRRVRTIFLWIYVRRSVQCVVHDRALYDYNPLFPLLSFTRRTDQNSRLFCACKLFDCCDAFLVCSLLDRCVSIIPVAVSENLWENFLFELQCLQQRSS